MPRGEREELILTCLDSGASPHPHGSEVLQLYDCKFHKREKKKENTRWTILCGWERPGKRRLKSKCFGGSPSLAPVQRPGDFESRAVEVSVDGCIHAAASFSCQLAGPFNLASECASISCQCEVLNFPLLTTVSLRCFAIEFQGVTPGNIYKLMRHSSPRPSALTMQGLSLSSVPLVPLSLNHGCTRFGQENIVLTDDKGDLVVTS